MTAWQDISTAPRDEVLDALEVENFTYAERLGHYQTVFGMFDVPPNQRPPILDMAHQQATGEMLNEIHAMLRHLCLASASPQEATP